MCWLRTSGHGTLQIRQSLQLTTALTALCSELGRL